jgi:hypothetical protein
MQPLLERLERGWFFTALAALSGVLSAVATLLIRLKGKAWRNRRQEREQKRAHEPGKNKHPTGV